MLFSRYLPKVYSTCYLTLAIKSIAGVPAAPRVTRNMALQWWQWLHARARLTYPSSSAVSMYVRLCGSLLDSNRRSAWAQKDRQTWHEFTLSAGTAEQCCLWLLPHHHYDWFFLWVIRVAEINYDQDREKQYSLSQSCCFLVLLCPPLGHSSIFAPLTCKETSSK